MSEDKVKEFVHNFLWKFWKNNAPDKAKYRADTVRRLQTFLKEHPNYTLDDIKKAVLYYFETTNPKYIRFPNYFVWKGTKTLSDLEEILENIEERDEAKKNRNYNIL